MPQELSQLGIRIDAGEDVKASELKEAYAKEIEATLKKYEEAGKAGSPEAKRHIEQLKRDRDRLAARLEELKSAKKEESVTLRLKLGREIKESLARSKQIEGMKEQMRKREKSVVDAINYAENITDPSADGARIPDYEGWGMAWESGYSDENYNNKTRWTLAGWLAAFSLRGKQFADEQMGKAVKVYDESDSGWFTVDAALNYEEMKAGLDMGSHISAVSGLGLAAEAEGFAAGYLAVGFSQLNKKQAIEYRDYFLAGLKSRVDQLNYEHPKGVPQVRYEHLKGRHQMKVIGQLLTPKEWLSKHDDAKKEFLALKSDAEMVSKNLGIELKDPALLAILAREKGSFTLADMVEIDNAKELVRKAAIDHLKDVHDKLMEKHGEVTKEAKKMIERNKKMKHHSKEKIDAINEQLEYAEKMAKELLISTADPLSEIVKVGKKVNTIDGYMDSISKRVKTMDEEMDAEEKRREEEAERKKKEEERRKKAAAATGVAGAGAAKGGKESKESMSDLEQFLSDKHLKEKKVNDGYSYSLKRPDVIKKGKDIQIDWKNPEVQKLFGNQLDAYLIAAMAVLSPTKQGELDTMLSSGTSLKSLLSFLGTMANVAEIIDDAARESTMEFPGKPSRSRMEGEYAKTFVPAWEKAGRRLNALVGNKKEVQKKDHKEEGWLKTAPAEVPPELQFLGTVDPRYVVAMQQIARYGNRPGGIRVQIPFSPGFTVPVDFRTVGNGYVLNYPGGEVRYTRIDHALREINAGVFHQRYVDRVLRSEGPYQQYEDKVGNLDKNREGRTPGEIYLEFDWSNPDPDVYVRATPHGHIVYTVTRENVGPYGEDVRSMYADNFRDFMLQMAHLRKWAEGPKHANRETIGARREVIFNTITNPYYFRNPNVSNRIGRVLSMEILERSEVVKLYLDWGGGENRLSPQNAMLNVWVTKKGQLKYTLNGPGVVASNLSAPSLEAMVLDVERRRTGRNQ